MKRSDVTYGRLGEVLRSFGFVCRHVEDDPPAFHYVHHQPTGALVSVPPYSDTEPLYLHHLFIARKTLELYGIAEPDVFDARLRSAA